MGGGIYLSYLHLEYYTSKSKYMLGTNGGGQGGRVVRLEASAPSADGRS